MKYDFDKTIDRTNDKYSFSIKWKNTSPTGELLPDDRICFQIADMDFQTAPEIIEDLINTAKHGIFGYSLPNVEYYKAVQGWYARRFDYHFEKDDIYVCGAGTHEVIKEIFKRCSKEKEGVIVLTPSYNYHWDCDPLDRTFVGVEMINNDGYYTIDFDAFTKACENPNNKIFILCHPHNPTGRVFTKDELQRLGDICRKNNVLIISDEVHNDLVRRDVNFTTASKVIGDDIVITCLAVNKTFNLAGLAMTNFIIKNPDLKDKFKDYRYLPTPFGIASVISAYTKGDAWVDELNIYLDNLVDSAIAFIKEKMPKAKCFRPEASYIIWIDFSSYNLSDEEIENIILNECHIIDQGGANFDGSNQFRRFCLASPKKVVMEGLERLAKAFKGK